MECIDCGDVFLADCPARLAIDVIADKWAVVVLWGLSQGPRRHGELVKLIGGISKKVLTQTLRRLQANGLVSRCDHGGVPPRVEYDLTELGRTLMDPIRQLTHWAERNGAAVVEAQERAEGNYQTDGGGGVGKEFSTAEGLRSPASDRWAGAHPVADESPQRQRPATPV